MTNDKFFDRKVVVTGDGSSSIYLPQFNEHYHSHHGAVQESKHVFMKMGWEQQEWQGGVDILEIGFGTGLNAWLVLNEILRDPAAAIVHYTSLEKYPVALEIAEQLDYWKFGYGNASDNRQHFLSLHEAQWNAAVETYPGFVLEKLTTSLQDFETTRKYDLVFFDAFSPRVQPELWTKEIFDRMFAAMDPGGILVTYCSKGEVRRNMIAAGFRVEKVPGPPGKREMLRAFR